MHDIQARVLTSIPELESVRSSWDAWSTSVNSDLDRFIDEAETLESVLQPHVIVFERHGVPIALLAGRQINAVPVWKFGYYAPLRRRRRYLHVVRDGFLGDFTADGMRQVLIDTLAKSLRASRLPFIHFNEMDASDVTYATFGTSAPRLQRDPISEKDVHWTTLVPGSLVDFYRSRSNTARRNNTRRYRQKLDELYPGQVAMKCFSGLAACIDDVKRIAHASYQTRLGVGFQATPEQIEICERSAKRGSLRVYILYIEGQAVAYHIGHVVKGTYFAEATAFDPNFKSGKPGVHLIMRIIEEFCSDENVSRIDWGYGSATYKEELGTDCGSRANYYYFAPSVRGQAMRLSRLAIVGSHRQLKTRLETWKLLDRVRTGWRQLGWNGGGARYSIGLHCVTLAGC
jgi:hypothetical protein